MAAIDTFAAMYGTPAWKTIKLYWTGDPGATQYRVYANGSTTPFYTGTGATATFSTGSPETRYDFRLEADFGAVTSSSVVTVFTRALPPPMNLVASGITDTDADLTWTAVDGVTWYEVCDVVNGYTPFGYVNTAALSFAILTPSTRHSMAVRSIVMASGTPGGGGVIAAISKWGTPTTFWTLPAPSSAPGVYDYSAASIHVWQAGLPGSSDPEWRPEADDWFHGDGHVWGDNAGVQTTCFFYGAAAALTALSGSTVTAFAIWLERASYGGDPADVLSRVALHNHATMPVGEPTLTAVADPGSLSRGGGGWVALPTGWATSLVNKEAQGLAWGGVAERYQVAAHTDVGTVPRLGDLRITVS